MGIDLKGGKKSSTEKKEGAKKSVRSELYLLRHGGDVEFRCRDERTSGAGKERVLWERMQGAVGVGHDEGGATKKIIDSKRGTCTLPLQ